MSQMTEGAAVAAAAPLVAGEPSGSNTEQSYSLRQ